MIRSISYSRYFRTAMAMAASRHRSARLFRMAAATEFEFVRINAMKVATTSTAAAANHFSCSRSSPSDRANLTTIAEPLTTSAAGKQMTIAASTGGLANCWKEADGFAHSRVAPAISAAVLSAKTALTNHAAGRHRRERSRPVGNSRNEKATRAREIGQIQADAHRAIGPAGTDPGAATSARCSYWSAKLPSP